MNDDGVLWADSRSQLELWSKTTVPMVVSRANHSPYLGWTTWASADMGCRTFVVTSSLCITYVGDGRSAVNLIDRGALILIYFLTFLASCFNLFNPLVGIIWSRYYFRRNQGRCRLGDAVSCTATPPLRVDVLEGQWLYPGLLTDAGDLHGVDATRWLEVKMRSVWMVEIADEWRWHRLRKPPTRRSRACIWHCNEEEHSRTLKINANDCTSPNSEHIQDEEMAGSE